MALLWTQLVKIAEQRAGLSESDLRRDLQGRDVSTQTITNWKKMGRPIPVDRFPLLVQVIGHGLTTDELHGRVVKENSATYHVHQAQQEDDFLANDISQMPPPIKEAMRTLVTLIVSHTKREERQTKKASTTTKSKGHRPQA